MNKEIKLFLNNYFYLLPFFFNKGYGKKSLITIVILAAFLGYIDYYMRFSTYVGFSVILFISIVLLSLFIFFLTKSIEILIICYAYLTNFRNKKHGNYNKIKLSIIKKNFKKIYYLSREILTKIFYLLNISCLLVLIAMNNI